MNYFQIQTLLAAAGAYTGGSDGDPGPKTMTGVDHVLGATGSQWSKKRRLIGAAQKILNDAGFEAGTVDGYAGHNTNNAFEQWQYAKVHGKREVVDRTPAAHYLGKTSGLPRQGDVAKYYGRPGDQIRGRLKTIQLPFSLRIDYNLRQRTSKMTVHEKCAPSLLAAMIAVRDHYGEAKMKALGLDRYAGGYNHRKMRGGSKWSMHSYGCAIDFYAAPNGLRMRCPQALFCGPDYTAFLDIMERHGWLPAVRLWGADAMHFQQARL
jgi:hypothetical protein